MNFFYPPPNYELGGNFNSFLLTFESFCDSVSANEATKKHAFLSSLPDETKFDMRPIDGVLQNLSYEELKKRAQEVVCGIDQCAKARQQLFSRNQAIGESGRSFVTALTNLGEMAYPRESDKQIRNDVMYNMLINGLRNRNQAEQLLQCSENKLQPSFIEIAKKLLGKEERAPISQSVTVISNERKETADLRLLITQLQEQMEELRRQQHNHNQIAYDARHPERDLRTCFNCGVRGHISRNCQRKRHWRGFGQSRQPYRPIEENNPAITRHQIHTIAGEQHRTEKGHEGSPRQAGYKTGEL
ncbi:uncharacterized protein LOC144743396 isoform X2 [Ciona intestinalis]